MEFIERVERLERQVRSLCPELRFPWSATLEQRLRWLEMILEEMSASGVYAEVPGEQLLQPPVHHTVHIKQDRITLHSLTADPASCVAGDTWFRSDLGKSKLAIDGVVANAKALLREGDAARIATASYTGNDTTARQIPTGFVCKHVVIISLNLPINGPCRWTLIPSATIVQITNPGSTTYDVTSKVYLHASNGFVVDNTAAVNPNNSAATYYYFAIG